MPDRYWPRRKWGQRGPTRIFPLLFKEASGNFWEARCNVKCAVDFKDK